jgi:hypothetical protein
MIMPIIKNAVNQCRNIRNALYRAKVKANAAAIAAAIIPCRGVDPRSLKSWPSNEYRREVALHVLTLHMYTISESERQTCKIYANMNRDITLDLCRIEQGRMDRIVNTYGHEL